MDCQLQGINLIHLKDHSNVGLIYQKIYFSLN